MLAFIQNPSNQAIVFGICWGLCEALAAIPSIKANSVFQLIFGFMSKKETPPPSAPAV